MEIHPVTPNASVEAVRVLKYLYKISGKKTLTGQHNPPLRGSLQLNAVQKFCGHYPALFGQDFGFSAAGDWDGINFRQQTVDECIRRHQQGFLITLMWHAVRPIEDEPVVFAQSIQGKLTDDQWNDLITPGTKIHQRWQYQVDVIAWHLWQLKVAGVPVLWRPYHEINGGWFWWGKRPGKNGTKKLWRMLFDRFVNFHRLDNLIWVYNCNEVRDGVASYRELYPGDDVVDVLATDIYRNEFSDKDYQELLDLAGDRPIAMGEVGTPPSPEVLRKQPRWVWFMVWGEPGGFMPNWKAFRDLYEDKQTVKLTDLPWVKLPKPPSIHHPILK